MKSTSIPFPFSNSYWGTDTTPRLMSKCCVTEGEQKESTMPREFTDYKISPKINTHAKFYKSLCLVTQL